MSDSIHPEEDVEVLKDVDVEAQNKDIVLARSVYPPRLSIVPLIERPFFPKMVAPVLVSSETLARLVMDVANSENRLMGLVLAKKGEEATEVKGSGLHRYGVIAEVIQAGQPTPGGPIQMILRALDRFKITEIVSEHPAILVKVDYVLETEMAMNEELKAYSSSIIQSIKQLVQLNPLHKEELNIFLSHTSLNEPGHLADFAAALTSSEPEELQEILETISIKSRLKKVLVLLKKEIGISKLQAKISGQIEEKLSKQQREFFLREELKAIKKELGLEKEGKESEIDKFTARIEKLRLSDEAKEVIDEEVEKLRLLEPVSPEFNVTRNYLDWLTLLPWGVMTEDSYDIKKAATILNKDHSGLEDVKERILEFLSVGIMKGSISGSIICFVGPPGVGKTSLGQSIARSIGRNFYRFSVGGMKDEAEIKGHRRTYIGALPGKFIQAMKICKSANPLIMIDEIDKIGASFQGDPASALLEVLDPEQNREFLDHYLDVRFDLSNVLFICTGNQLDTIPRPLLDRMEVINLSGYILEEKLEIARKHLIPKQLKAHGVKRSQLSITKAALKEIADGYAREPGVRGMENDIKKILRKAVKKIVKSKGRTQKIKVDAADVPKFLGKRVFEKDNLYKQPQPGVVMGLAWTSMGGDTLYIEATMVGTGKGEFKQTGQLGNVMVESSEIAYTFVRSFLDKNRQANDFFEKNFVHLHVPAGATPKDGPSAGVTMATSLYSLALNKPVKPDLAMTGELSLTGLVMPVGGIKEKTIAAKRAKVKTLVFPRDNKKDFDDLPVHIRKGLKVKFVTTFAEVVKICF